MTGTHHRSVTIDGRDVFYREAGERDAPVVVLLLGVPASSFMFRDLIPKLADSYRVIAPDYLGFGLSDAPSVDEAVLRNSLSLERIRWQYTHGVPDASLVSPDGARAFSTDLPDAEIQLLDGGHFLLESHLDEVASAIRTFLARALSPTGASR